MAPTPILNVNSSIVDFLKSRKVASDFDFRKQLFTQAGLAPEKGEFTGTGGENTALLNLLSQAERDTGVALSPANALSFFSLMKGTGTPNGGALTPEQQAAARTPEQIAEATGQTVQAPVSSFLESLFGRQLSPEELSARALEEVTGSAKFPLLQESSEAEKAALQLKGQQEKEKLISGLASKGLFFSGKRTKGLEAIDADTIAQMLGVDRKFALLIASGLDTAAQRIAKEAQEGNKDALTSLRSLGFDVNPLTGEIMPTLAARRAVSAEERAVRTEERLLRGEERAEEQLQLAREASARAAGAMARADIQILTIDTPQGKQIVRYNKRTDQIESVIAKEPMQQFTDTQANKGAATAEVSIAEFKNMDLETQNFFINRGNEIEKTKGTIHDLLLQGISPEEVGQFVQALNYPERVKFLLRARIVKEQATILQSPPKVIKKLSE